VLARPHYFTWNHAKGKKRARARKKQIAIENEREDGEDVGVNVRKDLVYMVKDKNDTERWGREGAK